MRYRGAQGKRRCRLLPLPAVLTCVVVFLLATSAAPAAVSPEAEAFVQSMARYFAGLDSFSFSAQVKGVHRHEEEDAAAISDYTFSWQNPNRLRMEMELPGEHLHMVTDGERLLMCVESLKVCTLQEQPDDLGMLVGWLTQEPSFRRLFSRDLAAGWMQNLTGAALQDDRVNGTACVRVDLTFARSEVMLWVRSREAPLPMRLFADTSKGANHPKGTVTTEIQWSGWKCNEKAGEGTFAVAMPEGFRKVSAFRELSNRDAPSDPNSHALVGTQAPPFAMGLLDGGSLDMAEHRGKNVVVLDYWATWCRPCRSALRTTEELAEKYAGRNVVFAAVNLMETPGQIRAYSDKHELKLPVALDPEGTHAELYGIEAVPTTIIIGLEGTVQTFQEGHDRWTMKTLSDTLDRILEGNEPVEEQLAFSAADRLRHRLALDPEAYCAVFVRY